MTSLDPKTESQATREEVFRYILEEERLSKLLRRFACTQEELQQHLQQAFEASEVTDRLRFLVEEERLTKTLRQFGLTRGKLREILLEEESSNKGSPKKMPEGKRSEGKRSRRQSSPRSRRAPVEGPEEYYYERLLIYTDGASRGNPGEAGAGVILKTPEGEEVGRFGKYLGRNTNNYAEYQAVLLGLEHAQEFGAREVTVLSDSELLVRQLSGEYRVKATHLVQLFSEVQEHLNYFDKYQFKHIVRDKNSDADLMANRAIDEKL